MNRLVVIALVVALPISACSGSEEVTCRPDGAELRLVAEGNRFDTDCLAAPADQEFTIAFRNDDTAVHNLAIRSGVSAVFTGESLSGGSVIYEVQSLPAGTYSFRCDHHPFMRGTFVVK